MDKRSYCKRHPSHKQSKGVCPYCLRERLSYISNSSFSSSTTTLSDSSTASSSSPYSSDSKPLKKSRSLAFVMEEEEEEEEKKKKIRFWEKLMGRKKEEGDVFGLLHHSKTVKEKASNRWVVFS